MKEELEQVNEVIGVVKQAVKLNYGEDGQFENWC